ncbi:MAG: hypothetical protein PUD58_07345 [Prevotella sp.]|uniref:hypothetical protein n=1 Tax=Prevotella sp. TaxID=59823 RepID=UPI00258CC979|nr:hypothetical protein [Prevotella sp.]MDD6854097.1 hypothetical protein [Prevotella sp.]
MRYLFTLLLMAGLILITSCNKYDDQNSRYPSLNKVAFSLSTQYSDTLYATDQKEFTIPKMEIMSRKNNTVLSEINFDSNNNDLIVDNTKIGQVRYINGKVTEIDVPELCKISRYNGTNEKYKFAYIIQPYTKALMSPYYLVLLAKDIAPTEIIIR